MAELFIIATQQGGLKSPAMPLAGVWLLVLRVEDRSLPVFPIILNSPRELAIVGRGNLEVVSPRGQSNKEAIP